MKRYSLILSVLFSAATLAACGGGSGTGGSSAAPPTSTQSAPRVALTFKGTTTLARTRTPMALSGTAVTISYNGRVVGTGTLDSNGAATISLQDDVPAGATVSVTAGSVTATFVLAHTMEDTAVLIQVNGDGTIMVSVAGGSEPQASPAPGDPNGSSETEDDHGNVTEVDENNGSTSLPANLPVSVTASGCTTLTLTPLSNAIASMRFEENIEDGDGGSKLKYEGPFTAAMTFPLIAQTARLRIRLFDANNAQLLDVKAPVAAFGITTCPPASPSASPSAEPSASPSAEPSESPSPQPTATP